MTTRSTGSSAADPGDAKTALFVCRCGPHIGEHLDLDAIASWAGTLSGVAFVETHDLLCAPAGQAAFAEALRRRDVSAAVVAGCSPKMHEKTFRDLAEQVGLNPAHVQLANIREHCAWVTADREQAATKARALIRSAVRRVERARPLERRAMAAQTDVLVIGGGVAGMEAALTAARAGRRVYLVEREISLGGWLIGVEEVAPTMECGPCLLAPRLAQVKDEPRIEVISNAEVRQILGFMGNFRATILRRARFVDDSCIGCEACYEVCPVETPNPFHLGLGPRKAINALFAGSVPAAAAIDRTSCLRFAGEACDACAAACPFESLRFDDQDEELEVDVGAVVIATGFGAVDLSALPALGHGQHPEVYTLPQLERLVASNGPTGGELRLRDGRAPASIALIHCAGSRRPDALPYCSGVCCVNAIKTALLLRNKLPETAVFNVYEQLVLPGPKPQRLLQRARDAGASFVRCADTASVAVQAHGAGGALRVTAAGMQPLEVEMVVLATGLAPSAQARALAEMLHLERDEDGFLRADHDVLHATGSALDGVYLAGCAAGPCDAATAVTRAHAAVGDALARLVPGREIELEMLTAAIDEERCSGCKLCLAVCPYKAISYDDAARVSRVTEAICRGCGTCAAACPGGACSARHFTDEQLLAEIGALIDG